MTRFPFDVVAFDLEALGADAVIDDYRELVAALERLQAAATITIAPGDVMV
ncbi:MAG TPA: hypothetical protein VF782_08705 [Allosphingosinicella sp.]|jgi:hypothetical protein